MESEDLRRGPDGPRGNAPTHGAPAAELVTGSEDPRGAGPVDEPIAGQLAGGFLAMVGGLAALVVVGIAPLPGVLANLLALAAVLVMLLGVWSSWVALRTIGARSDRAAGHVPRDVWWSRL